MANETNILEKKKPTAPIDVVESVVEAPQIPQTDVGITEKPIKANKDEPLIDRSPDALKPPTEAPVVTEDPNRFFNQESWIANKETFKDIANRIDLWEDVTDEERKFVSQIKISRALWEDTFWEAWEVPEDPVITAEREEQEKQSAELKAENVRLTWERKQKTQKLIEESRKALKAKQAEEAAVLRASWEREIQAAQDVLSFSWFGRSTFAAGRRADIAQRVESAIATQRAQFNLQQKIFEAEALEEEWEFIEWLKAQERELEKENRAFVLKSVALTAKANKEAKVKWLAALDNLLTTLDAIKTKPVKLSADEEWIVDFIATQWFTADWEMKDSVMKMIKDLPNSTEIIKQAILRAKDKFWDERAVQFTKEEESTVEFLLNNWFNKDGTPNATAFNLIKDMKNAEAIKAEVFRRSKWITWEWKELDEDDEAIVDFIVNNLIDPFWNISDAANNIVKGLENWDSIIKEAITRIQKWQPWAPAVWVGIWATWKPAKWTTEALINDWASNILNWEASISSVPDNPKWLRSAVSTRLTELRQERGWSLKFQQLPTKDFEKLQWLFKVSDSLDRIKKLKETVDTWPLAALANQWKEFADVDTWDFIELDILTWENLSNILKNMAWTAVSAQEAARLLKFIPNVSQSDKRFNKSVDNMLNEYNSILQWKAKDFWFDSIDDFKRAVTWVEKRETGLKTQWIQPQWVSKWWITPAKEGTIATVLQRFKWTTITPKMINDSALKYWIPQETIMAFMQNDSGFWTRWIWAKNNNPWNVWQFDRFWTNAVAWFKTINEWVDAVAENLSRRTAAFKRITGEKRAPTPKELASWVSSGWKEFFWVYQTDKSAHARVEQISKDIWSKLVKEDPRPIQTVKQQSLKSDTSKPKTDLPQVKSSKHKTALSKLAELAWFPEVSKWLDVAAKWVVGTAKSVISAADRIVEWLAWLWQKGIVNVANMIREKAGKKPITKENFKGDNLVFDTNVATDINKIITAWVAGSFIVAYPYTSIAIETAKENDTAKWYLEYVQDVATEWWKFLAEENQLVEGYMEQLSEEEKEQFAWLLWWLWTIAVWKGIKTSIKTLWQLSWIDITKATRSLWLTDAQILAIKEPNVLWREPGVFILEKWISWTQKSIFNQLKTLSKKSKDSIDSWLAKIKWTKNDPVVNQILWEVIKKLKNIWWLEERLDVVNKLLQKSKKTGLTLSERNKVKRLLVKTIPLYKKSLVLKDQLKAEWLENLRAKLQKSIEGEAAEAWFKRVKELNKDTQVATELVNMLDKKQTKGLKPTFSEWVISSAWASGTVLWLWLSSIATAAWIIVWKRFLSSTKFQSGLAKALSNRAWRWIMGKIKNNLKLSWIEKALLGSIINNLKEEEEK